MSDQNQGIGTEIYNDTASLGEFMALIFLVAAILVSTVLILSGLEYVRMEDPYLTVKGTVVSAECLPNTVYDVHKKSSTSYKCSVRVNYKLGGVDYSKTLVLKSSENYFTGEKISLWVNKRNYDDVSVAGLSNGSTGTLMIFGGLALVGGAYFNYYLTQNFKIYASSRGVGTILNIFRGVTS